MCDPSGSARFGVSKVAAAEILGDAAALRGLLAVVELAGAGDAETTRVHLAIAEAIVDAHIELLTEPGLTPSAQHLLRTDPRCMLVVAALHYVAQARTTPEEGDVDNSEMLRWATDTARQEFPVG